MVAYTDVAAVQTALGPSVPFASDDDAPACVDAANAAIGRLRAANDYVDTDDTGAPTFDADVARAATTYAVALWRERQSTESFASFDAFASLVETGGTWGQIRRLAGIPRGHVDRPLSYAEARTRRDDYLYPVPAP